jgi:hypothetical protein
MLRKLSYLVLGLVAVACLVVAINSAQALPFGVIEPAWDKAACAHCHMHVGDPAFAAQVQLADGRVLDFDDPGCMLRWEAKNGQTVHAIYVHEMNGTRWLPKARAAFVHAPSTPMGFGLGAVEIGTPGAMSWDAARREVAP